MTSIQTEIVTYEADGLRMRGQIYVDQTRAGKRPGVLVFPEAFGLGEHAKLRAQRLAALGYIALACDLHGEGEVYDDLDTVMKLIAPLREAPARMSARAAGGLDALRCRLEVDATRIAAIGYCLGGTMALELARGGYDIAGIVGFHSGLATARPDAAKNIKGRILVCLGADDPGIDPAQRAAFENEMRRAGVDWQMHLFGGVVHSFTNPQADARGRPDFFRYDAMADARSWASMLRFFDEIFAAPKPGA